MRITSNRKMSTPIILLMVLISTLFFVLFKNYQDEYFLLTNDLLTKDASIVDKNTELATDKIFYQWQFLDDSPGKRIHLLNTNDKSYKNIPISKGQYFSSNNTKEAIVGRNIKTFKIDNVEYIEVGKNKVYRVIGKLKSGTIDDLIVLNDKSLNEKELSSIVDGPALNTISADNKIHDKKWLGYLFDLEVLSNSLFIFTCLINSLLTMISVYIFYKTEKKVMTTKFLLGYSLSELKIKYLVTVTIYFAIFTLFFLPVFWLATRQGLIIYIFIFISYLLMNLYLISKGSIGKGGNDL